MSSAWTAAHVAGIAAAPLPALPRFAAADVPRPVAGHDVWDLWPVQTTNGAVAPVGGGSLWFALAAPAEGHPDLRHERARLRLLARHGQDWRDLGWAFPDRFAPGSRDWSGSAILDADGELTVYFTAAGMREEARPTFRQRLFEAHARLAEGRPQTWTGLAESVASDGVDYVVADQHEGSVGTIKAFRDPAFFRDPAGGPDRLVFAASLARSSSAFNGAVGIAERGRDGWTLCPPLISADALNNELERPHIVVRDGRYYLFWSTQRAVFAPGIDAPSGLYGMVADSFAGPYRPLNGTGLVAANPAAAPDQAYSWLVLDDLSVISFADRPVGGNAVRGGFAGGPAPQFALHLDGDIAHPA